jgi:hypothetical protein
MLRLPVVKKAFALRLPIGEQAIALAFGTRPDGHQPAPPPPARHLLRAGCLSAGADLR